MNLKKMFYFSMSLLKSLICSYKVHLIFVEKKFNIFNSSLIKYKMIFIYHLKRLIICIFRSCKNVLCHLVIRYKQMLSQCNTIFWLSPTRIKTCDEVWNLFRPLLCLQCLFLKRSLICALWIYHSVSIARGIANNLD